MREQPTIELPDVDTSDLEVLASMVPPTPWLQPNYSSMAGDPVMGAISNAYYHSSNRGQGWSSRVLLSIAGDAWSTIYYRSSSRAGSCQA